VDPKVIVLMIGTNNLHHNTAPQIADGIRAVVKDYLARCPKAHLILMGILPIGESPKDPLRAKITSINKSISTLAENPRVDFVDIGSQLLETDGSITQKTMSDFVHPTAPGYVIWANAIKPILKKYL
jgi:lysophospholipase L1-like esterase